RKLASRLPVPPRLRSPNRKTEDTRSWLAAFTIGGRARWACRHVTRPASVRVRAGAMEEALAEFLRHLALEKNASANTVKSYREDLTKALRFFREKNGGQAPVPAALNARLLRAHQAWLHEQGYAKTTIARRLAAVRTWCRFLCRQGYLEADPAAGLRGPRQ